MRRRPGAGLVLNVGSGGEERRGEGEISYQGTARDPSNQEECRGGPRGQWEGS